MKNIRLYPTGRKLKRPGGFYEKFREAWHLLKDEQIAKSESQAHDIPESHETAQEKDLRRFVLLDGVASSAPQGLTSSLTSMGAALSTFLLDKFGVQVDPAHAEEALRNIVKPEEASTNGTKPDSQQ